MNKIFRLLPILFLLIALATPVWAKPETYKVDPAHSSVTFKVGHFFSKVPGRFDKFSGTIVVDQEAMDKNILTAEMDAASINTDNTSRDKHLRSADYFDTDKFAKLAFVSKSWKKIADNEYEVTGDFTLHGVTKSIVLNVKSLGFGEGRPGTFLSGWEGKTKIKRSDYGMTSGTPAVGDDVEIEINVEAIKQ